MFLEENFPSCVELDLDTYRPLRRLQDADIAKESPITEGEVSKKEERKRRKGRAKNRRRARRREEAQAGEPVPPSPVSVEPPAAEPEDSAPPPEVMPPVEPPPAEEAPTPPPAPVPEPPAAAPPPEVMPLPVEPPTAKEAPTPPPPPATDKALDNARIHLKDTYDNLLIAFIYAQVGKEIIGPGNQDDFTDDWESTRLYADGLANMLRRASDSVIALLDQIQSDEAKIILAPLGINANQTEELHGKEIDALHTKLKEECRVPKCTDQNPECLAEDPEDWLRFPIIENGAEAALNAANSSLEMAVGNLTQFSNDTMIQSAVDAQEDVKGAQDSLEHLKTQSPDEKTKDGQTLVEFACSDWNKKRLLDTASSILFD